MTKKFNHDKMTEAISLNPHLIGLDGIVLSTAEANMFRRGKNYQLFHQPDGLCFDPSTKTLYNIEYKCSENYHSRAIKQLSETRQQLQKLFPDYKVINLYVRADNIVDEI